MSYFNFEILDKKFFIILSVLIFFSFIFVSYFIKLIKHFIFKKKLLKIGSLGESNVIAILNKLNKDKYYVLNNIMLKHHNKRTTQIDHVVISRKGIFVIETKNFSGVIYGNVKDKFWTHIVGKNKHLVYNIVLQNQGHINAIKNSLDFILLPKLKKRKYKKFFVSILLFNDNCKVKIKKPLFFNPKFNLSNFSSIFKNIKKIRRRNVISKKLYRLIIKTLETNNINSNKNLKAHVKTLNSFYHK